MPGTGLGYADILIIARGVAFLIELKAAKGSLSPAQIDVIERLGWAECSIVAVCRSIDDVKAALFDWCIPTYEAKRK